MPQNEISAVAQSDSGSVEPTASNPEVDALTSVDALGTMKQDKPEGDWVKYDNYRKTLNEKSRWRDRAETAEKERDELKRAKLVEAQNYKALYEEEKTRRERAENEKQELHGIVTNGIKYNAVKTAIESKGLKCKDFDVLFQIGKTDLLQTEDGENIDGVEQFIESSLEKHSYLFDKAAIPRTNDAMPSYQPDNINRPFLQLSKEQQQEILRVANAAQQRTGILSSNS